MSDSTSPDVGSTRTVHHGANGALGPRFLRLMFEENSRLDKQPALTSRLRRTPFIKSGWTGPKITDTHRDGEIARGKVPTKRLRVSGISPTVG